MAISAACRTCLSPWREQVEREKFVDGWKGLCSTAWSRAACKNSVRTGIFLGRGNMVAADDLGGSLGYCAGSRLHHGAQRHRPDSAIRGVLTYPGRSKHLPVGPDVRSIPFNSLPWDLHSVSFVHPWTVSPKCLPQSRNHVCVLASQSMCLCL